MEISVTREGKRIAVKTPYSPPFISWAKKHHGDWKGAKSVWEFDFREEEQVRQVLVDTFGADNSNLLMDVQFTATYDIEAHCGPIIIAGRVIASARGRDSGARAGDSVSFIEGEPDSGGSVKNWKTTISEGASFIVRDMPLGAQAILEELDENEYTWKIVVNDSEKEIAELIRQRDLIEARLKELQRTV